MRDNLPHFSHDNDSRNHAKMKALRARFGWSGYGQFWALNEMVASAPEARLDLSRKVVRSAVARRATCWRHFVNVIEYRSNET